MRHIFERRSEHGPQYPGGQWVVDHALPSGVLAEQLDAHTGVPLSVSPLTWSHATWILVIHEYLDKLLQVDRCQVCGQARAYATSRFLPWPPLAAEAAMDNPEKQVL